MYIESEVRVLTRGRVAGLTELEKALLDALEGGSASLGRSASEIQEIFVSRYNRNISWGALLPALYRLESTGYLTAGWSTNPSRIRPKRTYQLTDSGRQQVIFLMEMHGHQPMGDHSASSAVAHREKSDRGRK
jgi:DNA-binding PadR family transcriptional regulator